MCTAMFIVLKPFFIVQPTAALIMDLAMPCSSVNI